jgi:hypothetical protein
VYKLNVNEGRQDQLSANGQTVSLWIRPGEIFTLEIEPVQS